MLKVILCLFAAGAASPALAAPPGDLTGLEDHPILQAAVAAEVCGSYHTSLLDQIRLAEVLAPDIGQPVSSLDIARAIDEGRALLAGHCADPQIRQAADVFRSRWQPYLQAPRIGKSSGVAG